MKIQKKCLRCGNQFFTETKYIKRGHGKYCSPTCAVRNRPKKKHRANKTCAQCGVRFYRQPSHLNKSKSGYFFCARACKDIAQSHGGGVVAIQPSHYNGRNVYREIARRNYESRCVACGYDRSDKVLQVHHIDKNRNNNKPSNLAIVCPTCHREIHTGVRKNKSPFALVDGGDTESRTPQSSRAKGARTPVLSP